MSDKNIEVEKKYRIESFNDIKAKLVLMGSSQDTVQQIDQVYLFGADDFNNFKPGEIVLRLRKSNDTTTLTLKRRKSASSDLELETVVDNFEATEGMIIEMGYQKVVEIKKKRQHLQIDNITVCLDEVEDLGQFVELEILACEGHIEDAIRKIDELAKKLNLTDEMLEPKKYDVLLKQKKI